MEHGTPKQTQKCVITKQNIYSLTQLTVYITCRYPRALT